HPEFGPSVVSMWLQAHPDLPRPEIDGDHRGPSHTPVFAARLRAGAVCGPWATAGSKKRAEQDAAWGLTRAIAAGESHPATESPLGDPERSGAPGDAAPPSTESGEVAAGRRNRPVPPPHGPLASEAAAKKRARARKNPIAWVLSHAQHHGHPPPQWAETVDGPPHAPVFTCEVRYLDCAATGRGNTKTAAKSAAAEDLLDALLDETVSARPGI
ncbi:exoribonuclease II, partial [Rhodococcus sp. WS4]